MNNEPLIMDTTKIISTVGEEMNKLPRDKKLHMFASHGLCMASEPCEFDKDAQIYSSMSILMVMLKSLKIGLAKEYEDAGKDFTTVGKQYDEMLARLTEIADNYKKDGIDALKHETDLLGDLVGVGLYAINQSLRGFMWHYTDENGNQNENNP